MAVAKPMITEVFFLYFCLYTIVPKKMSSCKDYPCDVTRCFQHQYQLWSPPRLPPSTSWPWQLASFSSEMVKILPSTADT